VSFGDEIASDWKDYKNNTRHVNFIPDSNPFYQMAAQEKAKQKPQPSGLPSSFKPIQSVPDIWEQVEWKPASVKKLCVSISKHGILCLWDSVSLYFCVVILYFCSIWILRGFKKENSIKLKKTGSSNE
jgi:hypothetical protein